MENSAAESGTKTADLEHESSRVGNSFYADCGAALHDIVIGEISDGLNFDYIGGGRAGLKRLFIGSTAEQIVRHAICPVLVVPNRASQKKPQKHH